MLEVLEKNEMLLDEMRDWRLLLEANAVSLEGKLTHQGTEDADRSDSFPGRYGTPQERGQQPGAGRDLARCGVNLFQLRPATPR